MSVNLLSVRKGFFVGFLMVIPMLNFFVTQNPSFLNPYLTLPCAFCLVSCQLRRSIAKLELYRKFTNSLAVSVLLSVVWIGYEVMNHFVLTQPNLHEGNTCNDQFIDWACIFKVSIIFVITETWFFPQKHQELTVSTIIYALLWIYF